MGFDGYFGRFCPTGNVHDTCSVRALRGLIRASFSWDQLALGDTNGCHSDHFRADAELVADLGDPVHVLVSVWGLFRQYFHACSAYDDASALQGFLEVCAPPLPLGCRTAHEASGAVGCGPEA